MRILVLYVNTVESFSNLSINKLKFDKGLGVLCVQIIGMVLCL